MTKKEIELYKVVDEIIWNDWDPIGVNEIEEARNEYYGYLPTVFKMLKEGRNKQGISDYLYHTATVHIGLTGNRNNDDRVAELLIKKKIEILGE